MSRENLDGINIASKCFIYPRRACSGLPSFICVRMSLVRFRSGSSDVEADGDREGAVDLSAAGPRSAGVPVSGPSDAGDLWTCRTAGILRGEPVLCLSTGL